MAIQYIPQTDPYSIPAGFKQTTTSGGGTAYSDGSGNLYVRDTGGFRLRNDLNVVQQPQQQPVKAVIGGGGTTTYDQFNNPIPAPTSGVPVAALGQNVNNQSPGTAPFQVGAPVGTPPPIPDQSNQQSAITQQQYQKLSTESINQYIDRIAKLRGDTSQNIVSQKALAQQETKKLGVSADQVPDQTSLPPPPSSTPVPTTPVTDTSGIPTDVSTSIGLPADLTSTSIQDVIKKITTAFGLPDIQKQMKTIDDKYADDVFQINENPWISEGLRSKQLAAKQLQYEAKKDQLVNRLRLEEGVTGKAIDVYYKEQEMKKDILLRQLDIKARSLLAHGVVGEYQHALDLGLIPETTSFEQFAKMRKAATGGAGTFDPNKLLSVKDVQSLGVPYGTTVGEALKKGITPSNLSNSTKTMVEAAPNVKMFVNKLTKEINDAENGLGPAASRWREFTAGKVGLEDPAFTQIRTNFGLLTTLLMRMHVGARGGEYIMQHFQKLLSYGSQSPENLKAALGEVGSYADAVTAEGKNGVRGEPSTENNLQLDFSKMSDEELKAYIKSHGG